MRTYYLQKRVPYLKCWRMSHKNMWQILWRRNSSLQFRQENAEKIREVIRLLIAYCSYNVHIWQTVKCKYITLSEIVQIPPGRQTVDESLNQHQLEHCWRWR